MDLIERLKLCWQVLHVDVAVLNEIEDTIAECDELYQLIEDNQTALPSVETMRGRWGATYERPEFPIHPDDLEG